MSELATAQLAPPPSIRDVVRQRIARVSSAAAALLRCASACERGATLAMLAAGSELDPERALDAIDEALAAGLLREVAGRYEMSHALVRRAVYEELNLDRRARLHRRLAELLLTQPDPDHAEIAAHYSASRELSGAERGVTHALAAARVARNQAAYERAVAFFEMAVALGTPLPAADNVELANRRRKCACSMCAAETCFSAATTS